MVQWLAAFLVTAAHPRQLDLLTEKSTVASAVDSSLIRHDGSYLVTDKSFFAHPQCLVFQKTYVECVVATQQKCWKCADITLTYEN